MKPKLIVILGPTASGKSNIALQIAKKYNGYLISADSRQIYKEMDIMTGKDKGKWIKKGGEKVYMVDGIEEYMVDIILPDKDFSLYDYQKQVFEIIEKKKHENKLPILVGGTGLYISSIVDNYKLNKVSSDKEFREKLYKEAKTKGSEYLYDKLIKIDPKANDYLDKKNTRKIIRALEVYEKTKKPFSDQLKKGKPKFDVVMFGIKIDREKLYERINERADKMLLDGGWEEAKRIYDKYPKDLPAASGIGYRQLFEYFKGNISKEEASEILKRDTRRYAKRQMTWFRQYKNIQWIRDISEIKIKNKINVG